MISYKKVGRFLYTENAADVVALTEYILFEDAKAEARYALLKFINNLDQSLYGVQFEVLQYDADKNLLEKSLAVYDKFNAEAHQSFVPKAKLKLSPDCRSISVHLVSAEFDRIRWEKGEFTDNPYTFERYARDVAPAQKSAQPTPTAAPRPTGPRLFIVRDITRKNFAAFPVVFHVLVVILVLAFVTASALWFRFGLLKSDLPPREAVTATAVVVVPAQLDKPDSIDNVKE